MSGGRRALVGGALLAALAGCARALPPLERYRLRPVPESKASPQPANPSEIIAVEPYRTEGIYADPQIVYRVGETTYGAYPNREWALPLSTMLADATVALLRNSPGGPARVADEEVTGAPELVWRGAVREFEEVDRGDRVFAAVHLEGAVVRAADDSLLWQGSARVERPVPQPTMPAVVDALSELTTAAIGRLVTQAENALLSSR